MIHIILPQAFKRALPTLVGETIALVKDSSLVSVISITDLTKVGKEIVANTFSPFETWIVIALLYLSITSILSYIGHILEKEWQQKVESPNWKVFFLPSCNKGLPFLQLWIPLE